MPKKNYFQPVDSKINFPELEQEMIEHWKKNSIFEKSIESKPKAKTWTFLDGPPFITGLPHYGSLLSSIPKDLFPRFWTMKGYRVRRVWGWDCHGLPAENKVENKLGIKRKKDIEDSIGIKKFIDECKLYVKDVSEEWEWYVDHVGRWVDFKNAYKTMDRDYMESVMWVFSEMYKKGYIYKGLRVSLYCPHCSTPISNFEVAMDADNYKEITESATTYKYKLRTNNHELKTFILAWSTTPWNKIVTPALAVNSSLTYVKIKQGNEHYILSKPTLTKFVNEPYEIVDTFPGQKLLGMEFEPHYDYYKIDQGKKAFVIIGGDFVTAEEGTGVVTIAAYGEDDLAVMQRENIAIVMHVDEEGKLKRDVPKWAGMYYLKVNPLVNADLQARGLIYRDDQYTHTVPTCWRCHTRLIYAPQDAWYVDIQKLKPGMKQTNKVVNWYPKHFKYGRFLKSMEKAPDWCISRSRYWGSPVPVWECECGERFVPRSIAELEAASGKKIQDLHKPDIDEVTVRCQKCSKQVRRVPEVLDSWIEAGSASFAERHYPFKKGQKLESFFPPDFIVEYTGQIRAWFYVLHVIATALFESHAFKNVVVTGVILGTDGRKMSKNFGNYPDPKEMLQKYGGDALRLYLMGSPVMHGEDILISEVDYRQQISGFLLQFWNVYSFFVTYANIDGWQPKNDAAFRPIHVLDRWILSILNQTIFEVTKALENYDTVRAIAKLKTFTDSLSKWYVRRSRDRVGPAVRNPDDKQQAYQTLWIVLFEFSKLAAPFIPFVTEAIYRNLTRLESVHLVKWPQTLETYINTELEAEMAAAMKLASCAHAFRKQASIKVRTPLKTLEFLGPVKLSAEVMSILTAEINVYELVYKGKKDEFQVDGDTSEANQGVKAGYMRDLKRKIQQLRKRHGCQLDELVHVTLPKKFKSRLTAALINELKRQSLVKSVTWGETLSLEV